jgi:hypothetical protein
MLISLHVVRGTVTAPMQSWGCPSASMDGRADLCVLGADLMSALKGSALARLLLALRHRLALPPPVPPDCTNRLPGERCTEPFGREHAFWTFGHRALFWGRVPKVPDTSLNGMSRSVG